MNKVLKYFKDNHNNKVFVKNIHVYGWEFDYDHKLVSGVTNYLFEPFVTIENIASPNNENRPGDIKPKYYITIHDTGDTNESRNARFWSETVKIEKWSEGKYACSFQYVVGNDGVYHNIPDDEVAWHAGDGVRVDYNLIDTGLKGNNINPKVSIIDGYYAIDGVKSDICSPRAYKTKENKVIFDRLATSEDLNEQGILCKNIDGKYYIGETYFSSGYSLIANRGGNNNSIGIESCVTNNSDIHYTWQKTAKLVANLLYDNNLGFDDVKQHHYFSGKNCPQTMRMNGLWDYFMNLVRFEYQILLFLKEGYQIRLIENDDVYSNGRLKHLTNKEIVYTIETTFNDVIERESFSIIL